MKILKDIPLNNRNRNILPLIPLREIVIFPGAYKNFYVGREESIESVEASLQRYDNYIFLSTQKNSKIENPGKEDIYSTGVVAKIIEVKPTTDKKVLKLFVEGRYRANVVDFLEGNNYKKIAFAKIESAGLEETSETDALLNLIVKEFKKFANLSRLPGETLKLISEANDEEMLVNFIMQHLKSDIDTQIKILEELDVKKRLNLLMKLIYANIENLQLEKKIAHEVRKKMEKSQKEFFLNEQIKEIQKELGNLNEDSDFYNIDNFQKKLDEIGLTETVKDKVLKEQKRLIKMSPMSPEANIIRSYIDWILELPWNKKSDDSDDLASAKDVLNKQHYSLKKVKNRILEFLAVRKLNPKTKGPILCFVGPPGTGKTSLARSVADAIGREFVRISLGGVRDEAEIRGHRRTYLGALPGKVIQSMKKVKTTNPVFLLDEIDKMSSDFRGDPSSALLEVLDPEQNTQFVDHYLEIPYNLSEVMFITTANSLQGIPYPLLDRMETIYISSYTEMEKLKIARNFLIPREIKENGIEHINLKISNSAILEIIRAYTMESGVRSLQRQIASICRKTARYIVLKNKTIEKVVVSKKNLIKFLGDKKYIKPAIDNYLDVGVSHGLAWSELGGSLLPIEIVLYPGSGKIILTGKLGDVMKESAHTAFSFIRANAHKYNVKYKNFYKDYDVHIHFPEGAIPKDGPSGGIAITCGILSALTKTPIKSAIAMTGEITLTGKILPVGGLKEKTLAAVRHKKSQIVMPFDNQKKFDEMPATVKKKIQFHFIKRAEEAFEFVFEKSIYKSQEKDKVPTKPGKKVKEAIS